MENTESNTPFQAPSLDELVPLFPAYDIEAFIAQGGMGAVYQAKQISLDRPVAIKILPREFGADPEFRESFEAEAKAMARLNHPNLIGVYDFGDIDGMLYLVMELVPGKSLYHSCYGKAIEPVQASEIIISICRGIDHAHDADILHRDIKPANILLSQDATPKIGDFGLAAPMNKEANPEDVIYGTPGFTAPEVIARQPVDRRADIFSIGVMLHQLLAGEMPDESRTPPSTLSGCSTGYDAIVARSTHPDPNLRYASAGELADELTRVSSQPKSILNVPSAVAPAHSVQTVVAKKKSPALAITLVALAAVAGIAFISNNKKTASAPKPVAVEEPAITAPQPKKPAFPTKPVEAASVVNTIDPTPQKKDPLKQLARLKDRLASGNRDRLPANTVERNGSHFLFLKHPLSRSEAEQFAKDHGAHLAVLADADDRKWIMRQFETDDPAWIGAGLAANNEWQWMDASEWNSEDTPTKPTKPSLSDGNLAITSGGALISQNSSAICPLMLQWRSDGSNPCTMEAQLKRTVDSIEKVGLEKARYPVGTRTYEKSHFLLLGEKTSWEKARELSLANKGQLVVPSSPEENQWLASTFSNKNNTTSFWLGGYLPTPTSPWQWITKEAWHATGWKSGHPSEDTSKNRMLMSVTPSDGAKSWSSHEGNSGDANTIIIEWNKPKPVNTAGDFDLDKWLASVNRKIGHRVKPDVEKYTKERDQMITSYVRSMKRAAKKVDGFGGRRGGRGGRGQERIIRLVDEAMEKVEESGELVESLPEFAPESFKEIHKESTAELTELEDTYQAKIKAHLEFYSKGLLGKVTDLTSDGFTQQARDLQDKVEAMGDDTAKFLDALDL